MAKKKMLPPKYAVEVIERRIYIVRGQRVMLDEDLAELYGVATKAINQAMKRHPDRFPADFAFQLTLQEATDLRSQFVTSNVGRGGRRYMPWVFTEHGVAMLSSVLRSPMAVKMNIEIMRAFVHVRRLLATPGELVAQIHQLTEHVQLHDQHIRAITDALRKMMEPPPAPKGRIGFQAPHKTTSSKERSS
jgi:hypothetical protein